MLTTDNKIPQILFGGNKPNGIGNSYEGVGESIAKKMLLSIFHARITSEKIMRIIK